MKKRTALGIAGLLALGSALSVASAEPKYGPGASDTEIKIGQTAPFSGPASAYSMFGLSQEAYFKFVNENGGVNGRKINFIQYDDAFSPPKAIEQVRKLVEADEVLATFQIVGTPSNAAVQKYLNMKQVPHLFGATGATRFSDYENFPWTIGFNPNYQSEGRAYGRYVLDNLPDAKIGVIFQNDDLGRDYVIGLRQALGERADAMIVGELSYEVADPTVDSQIVRLKDLGANVLFHASTARFAAQAIKRAGEIGWDVTHILNASANSVRDVMTPAGLNYSTGAISMSVYKDPADPQWAEDAGMKNYMAFMDKYYPSGDKLSSLVTYGYSAAQVMTHVLEKAGDDLTRENILRQATSIDGFAADLFLPGISIKTAANDYRVIKQFQMMKFDGERWQTFGPIVEDDYQAK